MVYIGGGCEQAGDWWRWYRLTFSNMGSVEPEACWISQNALTLKLQVSYTYVWTFPEPNRG